MPRPKREGRGAQKPRAPFSEESSHLTAARNSAASGARRHSQHATHSMPLTACHSQHAQIEEGVGVLKGRALHEGLVRGGHVLLAAHAVPVQHADPWGRQTHPWCWLVCACAPFFVCMPDQDIAEQASRRAGVGDHQSQALRALACCS